MIPEEDLMKVVFLDVDGVLNTATGNGKFEESAVLALARIVNNDPENTQIVLSSSWRLSDRSITQITSLLRDQVWNNDQGNLLGFTPQLAGIGEGFVTGENTHCSRTDEILLWLRMNCVQCTSSDIEHNYRLPHAKSEQELIETANGSTW
eukprot:TRINITY_DN482_c0_g1_i1.p1 TRINITY_DN482_c0_g1~~TRINITY_DN482_c0_g1_i1.p1  ORF type:complete len:150 (-),score=35.62 TRINITY_DN482_c0_g1_i1:500-949(-)